MLDIITTTVPLSALTEGSGSAAAIVRYVLENKDELQALPADTRVLLGFERFGLVEYPAAGSYKIHATGEHAGEKHGSTERQALKTTASAALKAAGLLVWFDVKVGSGTPHPLGDDRFERTDGIIIRKRAEAKKPKAAKAKK